MDYAQINADLAQLNGDFGTFNSRCRMSGLGVFSVDTTQNRENRAAQRAEIAYLDRMYSLCGMDRNAEMARIAAELEATLTGGVWARSTSAYARRVDQLDRWVADTVFAMSLPETDPYHPKHWRN